MDEWQRIPAEIDNETDRRALTGILTAYGLEVRVVKIKKTNKGTPRRYVEYRDTGCGAAIITQQSVKTE